MCEQVVKTSHQPKRYVKCPLLWCECGHVNHGHGYGGCGGDTLRGCIWVSCKCEKFRLAEKQDATPGLNPKGKKVMHRHRFGSHHQGFPGRDLPESL